MDAEKFIGLVKGKMAAMALEHALNPPQKDLFSLGEHTGRIQGLQLALDVFGQLESDERRPQGPRVRQSNPYSEELDNAPRLPEQYGNGRR